VRQKFPTSGIRRRNGRRREMIVATDLAQFLRLVRALTQTTAATSTGVVPISGLRLLDLLWVATDKTHDEDDKGEHEEGRREEMAIHS
jgi:hypothetical protein